MLLVSNEKTIEIREADSLKITRIIQGKRLVLHNPLSVAFTSDGESFAFHDDLKQKITVWNIYLDYETGCIQEKDVLSLEFCPENDNKLLSRNHSRIVVWNVQTRQPILSISCEPVLHPIKEVSELLLEHAVFTSDGHRILGPCENATDTIPLQRIRIWDAQTGDVHCEVCDAGVSIQQVVVNPQEPSFASSGTDCAIKIWDANTGALMSVLREHRQLVSSIVYSSDGRKLVSVDIGGFTEGILRGFKSTVLVWDVQQGTVLSKCSCLPPSRISINPTADKIACYYFGVPYSDVLDLETGETLLTCVASNGYSSMAVFTRPPMVVLM